MMPKKFYTFAILCLAFTFMTACRTAPIYNVQESTINPASGNEPSLDMITQAILGAATSSKPAWNMKVVKPGHILATLHNRSHVASVDITYNTKTYAIQYNSSSNLKYDSDAKTIHSNYNSWIQNLDGAIKARISAL